MDGPGRREAKFQFRLNAAKKAWLKTPLNRRQRRQVKNLIKNRQELKYWIAPQINGANVTSTLGINDISAVAQGDTDTTRDGDRLQWCGTMDIRLNLVGAFGVTGDNYNTYRFIVLQWHPSSVPTVGDILLTGPSTAIDVYSQYNHDQRQQYKILLDKTFTTVGFLTGTSTAQSNFVRNLRFLINLNRKKVAKFAQFSGGGTTGTNKFYYILGSDSGTTSHPSYSLSTKIFFRDS